jgi:hypothetical protein
LSAINTTVFSPFILALHSTNCFSIKSAYHTADDATQQAAVFSTIAATIDSAHWPAITSTNNATL